MKWISVDERLPEVNRYYLVHCWGGNITKTFCASPEYFDKRYNQNGDEKSEYFEIARKYGYTITHWMPLPDPPEVSHDS